MKTAALPLAPAVERSVARRSGLFASKILVYGALTFWAFVCLFPIYWTVSTSFKTEPNVIQGALLPWIDFEPARISAGLVIVAGLALTAFFAAKLW